MITLKEKGHRFDHVTTDVVSTLAVMVVGQCVAYQVGVGGSWRLDNEEEMVYDRRAASIVDIAVVSAAFCYLLFYSIIWRVFIRVRGTQRTSGALMRWRDVKAFRNRCRIDEGYRIDMGSDFVKEFGNKYIGQGKPVDGSEF